MNYMGLFVDRGGGQFGVRIGHREGKTNREAWNRLPQKAKATSDLSFAALVPTARCRPVGAKR